MNGELPEDLRYARSHEWIRVQGDTGTVGLTHQAQEELSELVFVELPAVDQEVRQDEPCTVVESVKTATDIHAPVSGRIVEINLSLTEEPGLVNRDPYGEGWLFRLRLSQPDEVDRLLTAAQYRIQYYGKAGPQKSTIGN